MSLADCTVMVVEDHAFQRATTVQILANLGAGALVEAADGEEALRAFSSSPPPDVVICDLDMPGMDGIEFLQRVAALGVGTAVVIASGLDPEVLRAAETTARGYGLVVLGAIPKPLTARRLLQTIGLHEPGGAHGDSLARRPDVDPWESALAAELVGVRMRPRVELSSGRLGGLEARPHRLDPIHSGRDRGPRTTTVALAVTERVARAGLAAQSQLSDGGEIVDLSLIVPSMALIHPEFVDRLVGMARAYEVEPARVCVTIDDATLGGDVLEQLTRLRVRGFGLGFDGFGSSDATLPALERLPLTEITIAPAALARATGSAQGAEAFTATVQLLGDRGLRVVADGCATSAEWLVAIQAGCRRAQGARIGPPLDAEDVTAWLRSWAGVR